MKLIMSVICIFLMVQCGPVGDFHVIKQVDSDAASDGDHEGQANEEQVPEAPTDLSSTELYRQLHIPV